MKNPIAFVVSILLAGTLSAQSIDYNKIILPLEEGISIEEKLVRLAWNNHPDVKVAYKEVEISDLDHKITKREWLRNLTIAGNLNEFNIDQERDINNRSQFLPRYNFRLAFPLGDLFTSPLQKQQAYINKTINEDQLNALKLQIRSEVLRAYEDYKSQEEIYKIYKIAMDNAETNHEIIETSFEQGEETFERYNTSINNLNQRKVTLIQAERELNKYEIILEQMIGIQLEDVI